LKAKNPKLRVIGFTATPFRLESGVLHKGEGRIFTDIAYEVGVQHLIDQGYLSPIRSKAPKSRANLGGVGIRRGEYVKRELQEAVDDACLIDEAVQELLEHCADRRSWIVFCAGVDHATNVRDTMRDYDIKAELVTGETPADERAKLVERFRAGDIRALCNVGVFTTGFDAPNVDVVVMMRPTMSAGLYCQMTGRGLRIADGKSDCIAEGQRVLTNRGLVPIEHVTRHMRVWDGVQFVQHEGAVCKGEAEVIEYAGLTATPDHLVMTSGGWVSFESAKREGAEIVKTGVGGTPVQYRRGHVKRSDSTKRQAGEMPCALHEVRRHWNTRPLIGSHGEGGLQEMRQPAPSSALVGSEVCGGAPKMHKSKRLRVQSVRSARSLIRVCFPNDDGGLGARKLGARPLEANRSNRYERQLCGWQSSMVHSVGEPVQYECGLPWSRSTTRLPPPVSVGEVRRFDTGETASNSNTRGSGGTVQEAKPQAQRRVWDILNAGPLHRFTVEGLLVHNCMVMDFAGNIDRHGPIDLISADAAGGSSKSSDEPADAPLKVCAVCLEYCPVAVTHCPVCNAEFPIVETAAHDATATTKAVLSRDVKSERVDITRVEYKRHQKAGKPDSMRVVYWSGDFFNVSEWVCIEHDGFAARKARDWWRSRSDGDVPTTVDEALARKNELRRVIGIEILAEGKYQRVVGVTFKEEGESDGGNDEQVRNRN
jgi:hypothetical protein